MSAYLVTDDHINALITWAFDTRDLKSRFGYLGYDAQSAAQTLYTANVASLTERYGDQGLPTEFVYRRFAHLNMMSAIQVIKACQCYAYQACEADTWEASTAKCMIDAITAAAITHINGYSDAAWSIPDYAAISAAHKARIAADFDKARANGAQIT